MSVLNYSNELLMFPPQQYCSRSNVLAYPTKFVAFLSPFVIMAIITVGFETNLKWQNLLMLWNVISNSTMSLKISALAVLFFLPPVISLMNFENNTSLGLVCASVFVPFMYVKTWLFLKWNLYTERQNLQAAQNALEAVEMQPIPESPNNAMETDL